MELEKIVIVVAYIIVICVGIAWLFIDVRRKYDKRTFVYPKTGNKYLILGVVKSKNPTTGEWYKAVRYYGIESKEEYIREYSDFLIKFVTLEEWKREN